MGILKKKNNKKRPIEKGKPMFLNRNRNATCEQNRAVQQQTSPKNKGVKKK